MKCRYRMVNVNNKKILNFQGEMYLDSLPLSQIKFIFFKKATKIDEIFTVDLTFTT